MRNKRLLRILTILSIVVVFIFVFQTFVNADGGSVDSLIGKMDPGSPPKSDREITNGSGLLYLLSRIFTLLQFIGTGISLIAVIRLGIGYMLASIEEKADIKKRAWPILFGSVFIVATVNIMKLISDVVLAAFGDGSSGDPV